jgi:hypothetical protein
MMKAVDGVQYTIQQPDEHENTPNKLEVFRDVENIQENHVNQLNTTPLQVRLEAIHWQRNSKTRQSLRCLTSTKLQKFENNKNPRHLRNALMRMKLALPLLHPQVGERTSQTMTLGRLEENEVLIGSSVQKDVHGKTLQLALKTLLTGLNLTLEELSVHSDHRVKQVARSS